MKAFYDGGSSTGTMPSGGQNVRKIEMTGKVVFLQKDQRRPLTWYL